MLCRFTSKFFLNTAPKMSRAIISKKRLSQLKGQDAWNKTGAKSEHGSTPVDSSQTMKETSKFCEIKLLKLLNPKLHFLLHSKHRTRSSS